MSTKKDRFNFRRWSKRDWGVPSSWKRADKQSARCHLRSRIRQLIREGKFDLLPRYRRDCGGWY